MTGYNKTLQEFIFEANLKHCNKYNYSKSVYKTCKDKICIICPIHGNFQQTPANHLRGSGCPICGRIKGSKKCRLTTTEFINKANKVHNYKYNYNKTVYETGKIHIIITCKIHGDFLQIPESHLTGSGCQE